MTRIENMIFGLIAGDAIGAGGEFYPPDAVQKDFPQWFDCANCWRTA